MLILKQFFIFLSYLSDVCADGQTAYHCNRSAITQTDGYGFVKSDTVKANILRQLILCLRPSRAVSQPYVKRNTQLHEFQLTAYDCAVTTPFNPSAGRLSRL